MSLATPQYDIKLNGSGFILMEESYRKKAQQAFNARFSSGDPGLYDLSFWQFQGMDSDFTGGAGQDLTFRTTNRYKGSLGFDFRDGYARLARGKDFYGWKSTSGVTCTPTAPISRDTSNFNKTAKMVRFGSIANNVGSAFIMCSEGASNMHQLTRKAVAPSEPDIYQVAGYDAVVWHRGNSVGDVLVVGVDLAAPTSNGIGDLEFYAPFTASAATIAPWTSMQGSNTNNITMQRPLAIIPISVNVLLILEEDTNGLLGFRKLTFHGNTWVTDSGAYGPFDTSTPALHGVSALDANGTAYFAITSRSPLNPVGYDSRILAVTAASITSVDGVSLSQDYIIQNFIVGNLTTIAGQLFALGTSIKAAWPGTSYTVPGRANQQIINPLNGVVYWESPYSTFQNNYDNIIRNIYRASDSETYFSARNYLTPTGGTTPTSSIFRLRQGGIVEECQPVSTINVGTMDDMEYIFAGNSKLYWYHRGVNTFECSTDTRGGQTATGVTEMVLELSQLTGNTPLIKKTPYSVYVELSEPLTTVGNVMTVYVNGTSVGTMVPADGTVKEIRITSDLSATYFQPKITFNNTTVWPGYVRRIILRYVPTQFKKRAWGFGVRATKSLKLADGTRETTTTPTIIAELEAAWSSNTPVTFVDIDKVSYTVLVTDFDQRRPLLQRKGGNNLEAFVFLELLEV